MDLLVEQARREWPNLEVEPADFAAHLKGLPAPPAHLADCYLAFAAARGCRRAIDAFEARYIRPLPKLLAGWNASFTAADEVQQLLREKLLVASKRNKPLLLGYTGRGPLAGWVRSAAIRCAMDLRRGEPARQDGGGDEVLARIAVGGASPELQTVRADQRANFQKAFQRVLAELEPRDRTVLRLHFIDGLNIDQIGQLQGVHRATVARWIASLRTRLAEKVCDALSADFGMTPSDLRSFNQVRSQVDLSLARLVRDAESAPR